MAKLTGPVQVVALGDLHIGSTMGLMPKGFHNDDGNEIKLNPLQEALLAHWTGFWKKCKDSKIPTVVILMADLVDNNHHGTSQIWTTSADEMVGAAVQILTPVANLAHTVLGIRGTPAHAGAAGKYDNAVCREIGARVIDGQPSSYHLKTTISGVLFDIAHHGPNVGKKIWTRNNAAISFAQNVILTHLLRRIPVPGVILRAHVHRKMWQTVRHSGGQSEMVITPAWQWKTEFAHKIDTEDDVADVGCVIITVDSGKVLDVSFDCIELQQSKRYTV